MSRKKKIYTPAPFESRKSTGKYARFYLDMVESEAFKSLKKSQIALYMVMKFQYQGKENPNHPGTTPECFYFNRYLWHDKYKLYTNDLQFQKDRDALIEHGFIICEASGFNTRQKDIYRFCDKWKFYGTPNFHLLPNEMTVSLHNKLYK